MDQYWELSFHDGNIITTPLASISKTLDFVPADDGLLTFAALTMHYPDINQGWAGYLFRNTGKFTLPMGGTMTMTVRVDASPDASFDYHSETDNTCSTPATIRPFISSYQIPDAWYYATGRWWSNPISQQLEPGSNTVTFTVPIDAAHWTGVYGQPGTDPDFAATLASVKSIGIANGGGCFFTHGVQMAAGTASLTVLSVSYQANSAPQVHTGPQ